MSTTSHAPNDHSVLQVGPLKSSLVQALSTTYRARVLPEEASERADFLASYGPDVTAVVTSGRTGVDAALMSALPKLGAIVVFGVGYDATDVAAAEARDIGVSNTPDVLTDCVADTAVGLMIASDRRLPSGSTPSAAPSPTTIGT